MKVGQKVLVKRGNEWRTAFIKKHVGSDYYKVYLEGYPNGNIGVPKRKIKVYE